MIGPDKQHWFPIVLQKSVPYEYPATSTHAHRPLRRLLPPIFVKRPAAWTSAGEIEHYLTITPCYHLTILATAGLQTQPVMSLHFPLSRCWSWKYFLGGMWIIHFLSMTTHSLLRTVLHYSQCHHWQDLDCHHLLLFDYVVWDRWVSGLQPLIGFALPWPRWSPPHQQTHPYLLSQPYFFSHTSLYLLYVVFLVAHSKKSCKVVKYPDQISMCLTEQ